MLARINSYLLTAFSILILAYSNATPAAVILQYHHVSDSTPASTSISPAQFKVHMEYLSANDFNVVPLSDIVSAVAEGKTLPDKTVAITFDDAYLNIYTNGKPILDNYNFPYTIFVNAGLVANNSNHYMSWAHLKEIAEQRGIIANHGYHHDSLTRPPAGMANDVWLAQYEHDLMRSENLIKQHTGHNYRYFAYPYGEYTPEIEAWLRSNKFVGFSQQSGAVGMHSSLTSLPRFPASKPYDKISSLRDKLNSLPLEIKPTEENAETIVSFKATKSVTFDVTVDDFKREQLNCYVSGLGKQTVEWLSESQFTIEFDGDLPAGRARCNCTAPSISKPGRYYWYSKPWFVLKADGSWYPL